MQGDAHIFMACARSSSVCAAGLGLSGPFLHRCDGTVNQQSGHAWREAYVADLRLGVELDPAKPPSAPPMPMPASPSGWIISALRLLRGTRYGGGAELIIAVDFDTRPAAPASEQSQSQE